MGSRYPPGPELPRYTDRDHEDAANLLEPWEDVCPGCTAVRIDGRCFYCAGEDTATDDWTAYVERWSVLDEAWVQQGGGPYTPERATTYCRAYATPAEPMRVVDGGEVVFRYPKEADDEQAA